MSEAAKKKAWAKPEVRKIELTDEFFDFITSQAREIARTPVKRAR